MAKIYKSITALVGNTPLVELSATEKALDLKARVLVKVESYNPTGSVKDRIALGMVEAAERDGKLTPGATIIEPTSGNTGIGLAMVAAVKGYKLILTMPETMTVERRKLLKAYGAELVLTPGSEGMKGAIAKANELQASIPGSFIPQQFDNPANPAFHELTTAQEIWNDTEGEVDVLVAGVGTGGTVSGTARGLKAHNAAIKAYAVEPAGSPVITTGKGGAHKIQGIGPGFVPSNYDASVIEEVITVTDDEAYEGARLLAKNEAILAGVSSGAAVHAALKLAAKPEFAGKTIVAVLPDTGMRYLTTPLFEAE